MSLVTNQAAERVLLAYLCSYPDAFFAFVEYLDDDDFTSDGHKQTFLALHKLYVTDKLNKVSKNKLIMAARELGFGNYMSVTRNGDLVTAIINEAVDKPDGDAALKAVKSARLRRDYDNLLRDRLEYIRATDDSPSKMIRSIEEPIYKVGSGFDLISQGPVKLCEGIEEAITDMANNPGHNGVDLGYPIWQHRIGQLRNGSVSLVVATAKAGKSQFALRAALNAAHKLQIPVFVADSELNQASQQIRLAGMFAQVPYDIIEGGFWDLSEAELRARNFDDAKIIKIGEYAKRMRDPGLWKKINQDIMPFIEYMPTYGMSVPEVLPHIQRWLMREVKPDPEAKFPQCLVIYDYIKLATLDELKGGKIAEWQSHGLNVASLHDFGQKHNIPTLAFGQTNNELTDSPRCIAGGKRILENVDSATMLKRKDDEERAFDPDGSHFLKVWAARFGSATEIGHIDVAADLSIGEFEELHYSSINFREERQKRIDQAQKRKKRNDDEDDDD